MKFYGIKRVIKVDNDYSQANVIGNFWDEMTKQFPGEELVGLGTNWTDDHLDYYIGKIDENWKKATEILDIPDNKWKSHESTTENSDIEKIYRAIWSREPLDYEIEILRDNKLTVKVHYKNNGDN